MIKSTDINDPNTSEELLKSCMDASSDNDRMMLDTVVCMALLNFEWQEWPVVKSHFSRGYELAVKSG